MTFIQFGTAEQCRLNSVPVQFCYSFAIKHRTGQHAFYIKPHSNWSVAPQYRTKFKLELIMEKTPATDWEIPF